MAAGRRSGVIRFLVGANTAEMAVFHRRLAPVCPFDQPVNNVTDDKNEVVRDAQMKKERRG